MMEPTVTCPSALILITFPCRAAALLAKRKSAKTVGVAILNIGSKRLQGVK
jgi:hypothetical protein